MGEIRKPTKPGSIDITPVGHTFSGRDGSTPLAKTRGGRDQPTPITFGK